MLGVGRVEAKMWKSVSGAVVNTFLQKAPCFNFLDIRNVLED